MLLGPVYLGVGDEDHENFKNVGVYSQLGFIILIAHKDTLKGQPGEGMVVSWKSHACPTLCRSTFAWLL